MRISISGTHSSGKTTFLGELTKLEELKGFTFLDGPTRKIKKLGFEINEQGIDPTQLLCMSVDIQNIYFNIDKDVISDRCILDTYIYTKYLFLKGRVLEETMLSIETLYKQHIGFYDLILMPNHFDVDLVDDGERSLNLEFRDTVYRLFMEEVNSFKENTSVYMLGGDTEKRLFQFKQIMNLHYKEKLFKI